MAATHTGTLWQAYLDTLPSDSPVHGEHYEAGAFGDTPELSDELDAKCVVLGSSDEPLCIIGTVEVEVRQYNEVDARFTYEEDEGDRSLQHWRDAHCRFFTRSAKS